MERAVSQLPTVTSAPVRGRRPRRVRPWRPRRRGIPVLASHGITASTAAGPLVAAAPARACASSPPTCADAVGSRDLPGPCGARAATRTTSAAVLDATGRRRVSRGRSLDGRVRRGALRRAHRRMRVAGLRAHRRRVPAERRARGVRTATSPRRCSARGAARLLDDVPESRAAYLDFWREPIPRSADHGIHASTSPSTLDYDLVGTTPPHLAHRQHRRRHRRRLIHLDGPDRYAGGAHRARNPGPASCARPAACSTEPGGSVSARRSSKWRRRSPLRCAVQRCLTTSTITRS